MDDRESDKTYEPWNQVLPALEFECKMDEKMFAIMDLPLIIREVKRLREVVDKQQMQYVNLETAYHNSASQIEIQHEIDTTVEYRTENIKKYMKEKNKQLRAEVEWLREAKEQLLARVNRKNRQLVRATEWAYKQYCYKKEKMEDFDNYVWDEEE